MIASRTPVLPLIDPAALRELVAQIVAETLAQASQNGLATDRLAYTRQELSERTGLPVWRIRDAEQRGELVGRRVGKSTIYPATEVSRWLNETRAT